MQNCFFEIGEGGIGYVLAIGFEVAMASKESLLGSLGIYGAPRVRGGCPRSRDRKNVYRSSAVSDRDARRRAFKIYSSILYFNLHSFSTCTFHYGVRKRAVHILGGVRNLHLHFQH